MASSKGFRRKPEAVKKLWVSYHLQSLSPKRFVIVANKIIQGEYFLVSLPKPSDAG